MKVVRRHLECLITAIATVLFFSPVSTAETYFRSSHLSINTNKDMLDAKFKSCRDNFSRECYSFFAKQGIHLILRNGKQNDPAIRDEDVVREIFDRFCRYVYEHSSYSVVPNPSFLMHTGRIGLIMPWNELQRANMERDGSCRFYQEINIGLNSRSTLEKQGIKECFYDTSWRIVDTALEINDTFIRCIIGNRRIKSGISANKSFIVARQNNLPGGESRLVFSFSDYLLGSIR